MTIGYDNYFIPRLSRSIDTDKPVLIYRNLRGGKDRKYSIKQSNLVVGYTNQFMLYDCECVIKEFGREKVIREKRKNVHAYISGMVSLRGGMGITAADKRGLPAKITYDPYKDKKFMCKNLTTEPFEVNGAMVMVFREDGVSGAYLY